MTEKRNSAFLVILLLALAFVVKSWILASSDGGIDVLCDLEKTLMVLRGMNPYSVSEWMSPYPPFYFVVIAGVLSVGTGFNVVGSSMARLVLTLRYAALIFDLLIGLIIYLTLVKETSKKVYALLSLGLYLFVPSISSSETVYEGWFHGDTFGYFFVALAVFFFASKRYSLGSLFLGLAAIFKIHPILTLPLMAIWFYRSRIGVVRHITILGAVLFTGLVLPLMFIPNYDRVIVGFNSSTTPLPFTVGLLNLFYFILPTFYKVSFPLPIINLIWITVAFTLLVTISWIVWKDYDKLDPVDVLVMGVVIWLLPLRWVFIRYLVWFIIPFLMRGKLLETLLIVSIQEVSALVHSIGYNYYISEFNPFAYVIFFGVAVICAINETLALYLIVRKPVLMKGLKSGWVSKLIRYFDRRVDGKGKTI